MDVRMPRALLAALVLAPVLAWGLPVAAETAAAPFCAQNTSPGADLALGTPDPQPAQTCGPCLLEFCPEVGVRCSFSGCGRNNECCTYSCVCDESCVNAGIPGGTCEFAVPECPLPVCGNGVAETGEECDDPDFRGETCLSQGFDGGTLACTGICTLDTSGCIKCGDGICAGTEDCESCSADCDSRTKGNPSLRFCCGNGVAESAEGAGCSVCDGNC